MTKVPVLRTEKALVVCRLMPVCGWYWPAIGLERGAWLRLSGPHVPETKEIGWTRSYLGTYSEPGYGELGAHSEPWMDKDALFVRTRSDLEVMERPGC